LTALHPAEHDAPGARSIENLLAEWSNKEENRRLALKQPAGATLDKDTEDILKALGYLREDPVTRSHTESAR
jgi:hypothetical protein